ncbi:VOC family protein [Phenylobacterium sp. J367]|uniref:VOC family protein n=1 Tax=Phenylobacterium sp. J367 TaxID=2898435 RepID=UPI0021515A8C|nr:VOC family protein [Phenylobacterium sp. J367]MCR5879045.1 VOC family protein [Phenylobacterium sp. J367]
MRMIFVNLPVKDLEASKRFFNALGFPTNQQFTDDTAAAIVIEENISVMLLTHAKFAEFINGGIADASQGVSKLMCLSAASREEVDDLLAKAVANGGKAYRPAMDYGQMYGVSFQDPDGHVWEVMWMDPAMIDQAEIKRTAEALKQAEPA